MKATTSKRVLSVQDLSCFGHTSLLAEIAIMYRMGIQVLALPSTVLSANTDFAGYQTLCTGTDLDAVIRQWLDWELGFDAWHSGFLATPEQATALAAIIRAQRDPGQRVLVDPVLGDAGKLYGCYNMDMVAAMRELVKEADIITPNTTEAAFLLGEDRGTISEDGCKAWARRLSGFGPRHVVITSAPSSGDGMLQNLYYDAAQDSCTGFAFPIMDGGHPGSGDCFAAFMLAGVINGYPIPASLKAATLIMSAGMRLGVPANRSWREGIALERLLRVDLEGYYREAGTLL